MKGNNNIYDETNVYTCINYISTTCQPCPVGEYSESYTLNATCSSCGTAKNSGGGTDNYVTTVTTGSSSVSDCECLTSFEFADEDGSGDCLCPGGTEFSFADQSCVACAQGLFSESHSLDACSPCSTCTTGGAEERDRTPARRGGSGGGAMP